MAASIEKTGSLERLIATLNHKKPDRIPIDFGGTPTTGVHVSCVAALRDYYGLKSAQCGSTSRSKCLGV
jgi:hypothetical protein